MKLLKKLSGMKFTKKIMVISIAVIVIYTIAVLVLIAVGREEPQVLTASIFAAFAFEWGRTASIKNTETKYGKNATDNEGENTNGRNQFDPDNQCGDDAYCGDHNSSSDPVD